MALRENPVALMPLSKLLPQQAGVEDIAIGGLQLDSRQLQAGDAFIALPGDVHDGRDYLGAAAAAGASVILAEVGVSSSQRASAGAVPVVELAGLAERLGEITDIFFAAPSEAMHLVGVTGTNGKTTTSRLLAQLLRAQGGHCGVIGTLGATLGNEAADASNTTPDVISLQRQLAQWRDQSVEHAVLEVSSHSLVQGRVDGLSFNSAIFTNLTHDHLDYHGDMQSYGLAKSQLFLTPELQTAIINLDDPYAKTLMELLPAGVNLLRYSLRDPTAEVSADSIEFHHSGLEARLTTPWGEGLLHSPLAGDFNLSNLMAAISAACVAGVSLQAALAAAPQLHGVAGRMEYVANGAELQLVVDYAHTPDALAQALRALRAHTRGQLICVFGCGGDRDRDKRPLMAEIATECADRVIVTSDNPRGEDPLAIIADITAGASGPVEVESDRAAAIALAVRSAAPGDCVLVAGKGHEGYQQIGDQKLPFSDVAQLRLALAAEGSS
ncbi:MAG: UDP-N-acetylmuramoyl-L-alanyl-D-glutamate--2,6-diaminopimelate ligase [Halieaceae bacterium]